MYLIRVRFHQYQHERLFVQRTKLEDITMTISPLIDRDNDPVYTHDNKVYINGFVETDPDVVDAVGDANDPVASVHRLLALGAQVQRFADSKLDGEILTETVERLTRNVEGSVESAVLGIAQASKELLDGKSGALPAAMNQFREGFERLLDENFDPDSKKSIIAKFETAISAATSEQTARINRLLDPNSTDSPLAHWRNEILKTVKSESADVAKQVTELGERLVAQAAGKAAEKSMFEKTTAKGFRFEEVLHSYVEAQAVAHGDMALQTGNEPGVTSRRGDELVALNPDDTRGQAVRIVWECKDKKMSLRKILDELGEAMVNREASVGVAVFGSQDSAPISVPFAQYGDKAVIVLAKDEPDPALIRLAYMWARWVARRSVATEDEALDIARVQTLIDEARRTLERVTQIRRFHTTARKGIEEAGVQVDAISTEISSVLDRLVVEIDKQ